MIDKKFKCDECGIRFAEAIYWFDSLHFANWPIREIILFCGPKCVQKWHEEKGVADWPHREPRDYPKGDGWKIIQNIV